MEQTAPRSNPPRSNPWVVLATLLVIYIFNFADRYLLTGLIGPIKQEFDIGDGMIGLLMGPAFVVLYVVMGVPFARMADRGSRIRIIAAGCVLWSLATAATGLATGPVSLGLARIGVGVGEAAFVAPAYSLLTDYFKPERRGLAFAILGLATYFGQIAGQAGGPAWRIGCPAGAHAQLHADGNGFWSWCHVRHIVWLLGAGAVRPQLCD
jgi:MFS family permease